MSDIKFNINSFVKGSSEEKDMSVSAPYVDAEVVDPSKVKKGVKRKRKSDSTEVIVSNPNLIVPQSSMSFVQENIPYAVAYQDTNKQIDDVIADLNMLGAEVLDELHAVRQAKTLKGKYTYINDMTATASSIISTKLSAIKEKNTVINNINRMELDRLKQIKGVAAQEDDTTRIANLYDAFVNTPIGAGPGVLGPSMQDMIVGGIGSGVPDAIVSNIGGANDQLAWEQSLDPAQNRMVLEARNAIDTVVVYDETTGNRWFEIIDKATGQPMQGVEKPDNTFIYDLDINIRGGYAKDSNRGVTYPLMVVNNGDMSINEY